ncbi:transmembrane protease serine 6-like [Penaeus monodon]|uniref:transmembrane protease serine 6-like n=1 Tax=Penaeus monodon TaxID=6687 RepID=UPI0018A7185B|nr:transmembrane protease serine 6-like [Penaeus monodon]
MAVLPCLFAILSLSLSVSGRCGVAQSPQESNLVLESRIIGGRVALKSAWPWAASLRSHGQHFCGASLVTATHLLTAAHCVSRVGQARLTVVLVVEDEVVEQQVSAVVPHPDYDGHQHDIALLKVEEPFSSPPLCLSLFIPEGVSASVVGWGKTSPEGPHSEVLRQTDVTILPGSRCRSVYRQFFRKGMVCAGSEGLGQDACQGDSGGPLMVFMGGAWVQVGVVSFGYGCARPEYPGVYTSIPEYIHWVIEVLQSQ